MSTLRHRLHQAAQAREDREGRSRQEADRIVAQLRSMQRRGVIEPDAVRAMIQQFPSTRVLGYLTDDELQTLLADAGSFTRLYARASHRSRTHG